MNYLFANLLVAWLQAFVIKNVTTPNSHVLVLSFKDYGKCSKISNTFTFCFHRKCGYLSARVEPDQTAS